MDLFQPEIARDHAAQRRVRDWIEALRSGRYERGTGCLRQVDAYCCLGVACDLYDPDRWRPGWDGGETWDWGGLASDLSGYEVAEAGAEVRHAYRLRTGDGQYRNDDRTVRTGARTCLAYDNDSGWTFAEIADVIERELMAAVGAAQEVIR